MAWLWARAARSRGVHTNAVFLVLLAGCGGLSFDLGPGGGDAAIFYEDAGGGGGNDAALHEASAVDAQTSDGAGPGPEGGPTDATADAPRDASGESSTEAGHDSGGGFGYGCTGASPSFAYDLTPIFNASCAGGEICHGGGIGFGDAGPRPPWPYTSLVNVKASRDSCSSAGVLVKPSDVADSYLVKKLTGLGMCPSTQRMPIGGALTTPQIQAVVDWICQGAQDD